MRHDTIPTPRPSPTRTPPAKKPDSERREADAQRKKEDEEIQLEPWEENMGQEVGEGVMEED